MKKRTNNIGMLELRSSRIYLIMTNGSSKIEINVTPLWHFFKEVQEFIKEPKQ